LRRNGRINQREAERLARAFGTTPGFGAIVSCYFPENENPNRPGIKPRPCCVLGAKRSETGRLYLLVAYGTGVNVDAPRPGEMSVSNPDEMKSAGLHKPTKFVFTRVRALPFRYEFFRPNKEGTVVLGNLTPELRKKAIIASTCARRIIEANRVKLRRTVPVMRD
jgi:hypothetical protein